MDSISTNTWLQASALVGGGILLGFFTEWMLARFIRTFARRTASTWDDLFIHAIHRMPLVWWTAAGVWGATLVAGIDPAVRRFVSQTLVVVVIASVTLVAARLASRAVDRFAERSGTRVPGTTLVNNLVRLLVATIGLFLILQNLDILEQVESVALDVARLLLEDVAGHPPARDPLVRYRAFGDSSIDFDLLIPAQAFVDQFVLRHELIKRLHRRFNEDGIEIPFPIRTVHLQTTEGEPPPAY